MENENLCDTIENEDQRIEKRAARIAARRKRKKKHPFLRIVAFFSILLLLIDISGRYISIFAVDGLVFWRTTDFYFEKNNSLDAVIIGSSSTYCFWDATYAWTENGIAVYPYSTPQQPLASAKYVIEECKRSQPDAVYIINLNLALVEDIEPAMIHFLSDVMPPSLNRIRMIEDLCEMGGYSGTEKIEYYYPLFAMHERWKLANLPEKNKSGRNCKGASVDDTFLTKTESVEGGFHLTDEYGEISQSVENTVTDLLEYLKSNNIQAAFFLSPGIISEENYAKHNTIMRMIEDSGYTVYNGFDHMEDMHLSLANDYCDNSHTNITGARKFTSWLSGCLIDEFGFQDKRENSDYSSWDDAAEHYNWIVRCKQMSS